RGRRVLRGRRMGPVPKVGSESQGGRRGHRRLGHLPQPHARHPWGGLQVSRVFTMGAPPPNARMNRRRFLTAAGATALTLPFLRALPTYAGSGKQYLILVFSPNGVVRHLWGADAGATPGSFTLRPYLQPLAKYQSQMVIIRGLCNKA